MHLYVPSIEITEGGSNKWVLYFFKAIAGFYSRVCQPDRMIEKGRKMSHGHITILVYCRRKNLAAFFAEKARDIGTPT
jgi:hypothetical protein